MNTQHDCPNLQARFTSWIRIVIHRAKLDYLKYQKRHVRDIPIGLLDSGSIGSVEVPDDIGDNGFLFHNRSLEDAFYKLPISQQQVLYMRIAIGLSSGEIANVMGCDSAKISRQYYKALSTLKLQIYSGGGSDGS